MAKWRRNMNVEHAANKTSREGRFGRRVLFILLVCFLMILLQAVASASTVLPGLRAPLLDTPATPSTFRSGITSTYSGGLSVSDAEIQELARGLKYDPGLMYKFVHDHIRFTPMWGEVKGPYMTWMDRSGNSFDQAGLMLALLKEAADHGTQYTITNPMFIVGEIQLSPSQFTNWFGLPSDVSASVARKVLARSGLYGTVASNDTVISYVRLEHVWVRVTIGGNTHNFDPSFKVHTVEEPVWNLDFVMGYQTHDFLADANDGYTLGNGYIKDLNTSNIADHLKDYSANLIDYIKDNQHGADLKDIVGGVRIEPVDESALPPTSLPYTVASNNNDDFPINQIPNMYRRTLRIQHAGLDETFFSSDIYGRRLTLQYNGSNQPQLVLDGAVQATGSATTPGQAYDLTFSVDHPYNAGDFDQSTTTKVVSGGFYHIVNGWGDSGTQILRKQRDLLEEYRYDGYSDTSEQVLGESYGLIGTTWLAQISRVRAIAAPMVDSILVNHHFIGVAGQNESGGSPYIDMPLGCMAVTSDTADTDDRQGVFLAVAGHASAYESQVIRQLQDCNAVSTVSLIEKANADDTDGKIYRVTDYNWGTVQAALVNYDADVVADVNEYIDAGFTVYLPEKGDLTEDDWTGAGYQALLFDASSLTASYIIGGGYSGGAAAGDTAMSPATVFDNCYGAEYGRSGDGAYGFSSTDLTIGSGGYPFGLSFSRQYSTRRRFEDGPLGLGWTHSLDIQALVKSDAFQFLGVDSPIDAAPQIVSILVTADIPSEWSHVILNDITASLCQSWLMDQMIAEVVVIKQGSGTTTFVKDPNGTYQPPSGQQLQLVERDDNGNFLLKNSSGILIDFDSENRVSQWSDPFNNTVDFTYTSGKLTQVTSKVNNVTCRSLTLSYDGDHIRSITDSAGRSVTYDYDAYDQLDEFTNLDGNDVTYAYDDTEDGLMTEIYSPIDANDPVLEIIYDGLGRMKQQVDANDCTWDYYLATYRSEVVEPNQVDPNDVRQRFSTVSWVNPEVRTSISTDQMGRTTTSEYDGQGRTVSVLNPSGMTTEYTYDEDGNLIETESLSIAGSDDPNVSTSSEYRSYPETPASNTERWFVYVDQSTSVLGQDTIYTYDFDDPNYALKKGRLVRITYPDVNAVDETGADEIMRPTEEFTYYSDGRIHEKIDKAGVVTEYEYYDLTTYPSQGGGLKQVVVDVDGLDLTTQYSYDIVGRQASVTDPRGHTTLYEYFDSGLLRRTISPSPFNYGTVYEYYADGKLKHVKAYSVSGDNDFTSDANCVSLWRLESGALGTDSIGTNTLTNTGVSTYTSTYREGSACGDFERSQYDRMSRADSVLSSDFPLKNGGTNRSFSVCAWFRQESIVSSSKAIVSKWDYVNNKRCFTIYIDGNGCISHCTGYNDGSSYEGDVSSETLSTGVWYHVGATYNDNTRAWSLRVWNQSAASVVVNMSGIKANNINVEDAGWAIGNTDNGTTYFDGLIDEVVVFNDVLSSSEIDQVRRGTYGSAYSGDPVYLQSITYNSRGQKETVRGPYPENATATELAVNYTQYRYDDLGRLWQVEDAEGNVTTTRYYPDGQTWKVIDANDNATVTYTYNADGSLKETRDANGNVTSQDYNGFMAADTVTYDDDTYMQTTYDNHRRLQSTTNRAGDSIYVYYYDVNNVDSTDLSVRVKGKYFSNSNNVITYRYDILGRVVEISDDTGTITKSYDNAGRLVEVEYPGSKVVSYEYDDAGNRTKLTYPDSTYITYSYDALSRLTEVRDQASTVLAEYTYDDLSRRTELGYANGTNVAYTYDTASRLLDVNNVTDTGQLKYAYTYDDVGNRLTMSITDSAGTSTHSYTYDDIYQVTGADYPVDFDHLATDTTFNYDPVGNRTSVVDDDGTVSYTANELNQYTSVADVNCTYDDNGNMTYDGACEYIYDAENRLIQVNNTGSDPLGPACDCDAPFTTGGDAEWFAQTTQYYSDNDAAQSGAIGANQETWMEMTVEGSGTFSFRYKMDSASGDSLILYVDDQYWWGRTSAGSWYSAGPWTISGTGPHTIRWKYIKDGSGSAAGNAYVDYVQWSGDVPSSGGSWTQIIYTYDPEGRRIAKDVDGTVTRYLYDGDHCIAEYDASSNLLRKYIYGPGVDQPICMIESTGSYADTYYYHYDALGSVVALSDADGDTVEVYEYDVYGQVAASDPNHPNPFLFTGRRYDTETGLYYYRARYYNPSIGRFLQTDPIGYGDGMNLYAYCGNNPIRFGDPSGLMTMEGWQDTLFSISRLFFSAARLAATPALLAIPIPGARVLAALNFAYALNDMVRSATHMVDMFRSVQVMHTDDEGNMYNEDGIEIDIMNYTFRFAASKLSHGNATFIEQASKLEASLEIATSVGTAIYSFTYAWRTWRCTVAYDRGIPSTRINIGDWGTHSEHVTWHGHYKDLLAQERYRELVPSLEAGVVSTVSLFLQDTEGVWQDPITLYEYKELQTVFDLNDVFP